MDRVKGVMKSGWHPEKKSGSSSGESRLSKLSMGNDRVSGWVNRGGNSGASNREAALAHQSKPLSTLKDPSTFGAPPKHVNTGSAMSYTPDRTGMGAPLSRAQIEESQRMEDEAVAAAEEEAAEPKVPSGPYRADTTGLQTAHFPKPPKFGPTGGGYADESMKPVVSPPRQKPKPSLPPRLPPRQTSGAESPHASPSQTYPASPEEPPAHRGVLNQNSLQRLGNAGVSVPGFGIGGTADPNHSTPPASPGLPNNPRPFSPPRTQQSPQLSELQQRFAKMGVQQQQGQEQSSPALLPSGKKPPPPPPPKKKIATLVGDAPPTPPPIPFGSKPRN